MQLAKLKSVLDAWQQILRQLDRLAERDGTGPLAEQSRHIRQLIADAERAIALVQHGATSGRDHDLD